MLFYESTKHGGRGELVALARVRQAYLRPARELVSELEQSVLSELSLAEIGMSEEKTVTVFDNIFHLPNCVPLSTLQRIGCGRPNDLISEWKRIEREDEPRRVSLEVMLRGTCEPQRLLDIAENFILFSEHKQGLVKALAQNHQYLGVNNAIAATLKARKAGHGRGGVFWQTQGSGKSFSMVFCRDSAALGRPQRDCAVWRSCLLHNAHVGE